MSKYRGSSEQDIPDNYDDTQGSCNRTGEKEKFCEYQAFRLW